MHRIAKIWVVSKTSSVPVCSSARSPIVLQKARVNDAATGIILLFSLKERGNQQARMSPTVPVHQKLIYHHQKRANQRQEIARGKTPQSTQWRKSTRRVPTSGKYATVQRAPSDTGSVAHHIPVSNSHKWRNIRMHGGSLIPRNCRHCGLMKVKGW